MRPVSAASGGLDIAGVTADSRRVAPGYLFAALPGSREDGRRYIADAVSRGAVAVLAPEGTSWPPGVPPRPLLQDQSRAAASLSLLQRLQGPSHASWSRSPAPMARPARSNSCVSYGRPTAGRPPVWARSGLIAPGFDPGPGLTTPDPVSLAETLAEIARAGIQHAAMEASSHGLDQFRLDGVRLTAGAFTNLTRDHLDYHGSLDAYRQAKLRLFAELLPAGAPVVASSTLDFGNAVGSGRCRRAAPARPAHRRRRRPGDPDCGRAAETRWSTAAPGRGRDSSRGHAAVAGSLPGGQCADGGRACHGRGRA